MDETKKWVIDEISREIEKHRSEHRYRIERLEKCCEKMYGHLENNIKHDTAMTNALERLDERLEEFKNRFDEHDKKEMAKYDSISKELRHINYYIAVAVGIGVVLEFLVSSGLLAKMLPIGG